jgi:hypothetical protein
MSWLAWSRLVNTEIESLSKKVNTAMATAADAQAAVDALKPVVAQTITLLNSLPARIAAAANDAAALEKVVADTKQVAADLTTANAAVPA